MSRIFTVAVLVLLAVGCASNRSASNIEATTSLPDKHKDCSSVSDLDIESWCSAYAVDCDCSESTLSLFRRSVDAGLATSDIILWKATLPDDYSPEKILKWATTGIPSSAVSSWVAGGYKPDAAADLFVKGVTPEDVRLYQDAGVGINDVAVWKGTGINPELAALWIGDGINAESASEATKVFDLRDHATLKRYLLERRFSSLSASFYYPPKTLICSKSNVIAELVSMTNARLNAVARYQVLSADGFTLPELSLFSKSPVRGSQIVRRIRRIHSSVNDWSLCPLPITKEVGL